MIRAVALTSQDWTAKGASVHTISDNNLVTAKNALQAWLNTSSVVTAKSVLMIAYSWDGSDHNFVIVYYLEQINLVPTPTYGALPVSPPLD